MDGHLVLDIILVESRKELFGNGIIDFPESHDQVLYDQQFGRHVKSIHLLSPQYPQGQSHRQTTPPAQLPRKSICEISWR